MLLRRVLAAGAGTLSEHLLAIFPCYCASTDYFGQKIIRDGFNLTLLQGGGWRRRRPLCAEFGFGHAIATLVRVCELIIVGHWCSGPAARDHFDQLISIHGTLAQVRGAAIGLRFA